MQQIGRGCRRPSPPPAPSHSNGGHEKLPGLGGMVCLGQPDKPPPRFSSSLPSSFLLTALSQFSQSPLTLPSHTHSVPNPPRPSLEPTLNGQLRAPFHCHVPCTQVCILQRCTGHEVPAQGPQGVSPLRGRKEVQTPQPAVLGFLHLVSTTFLVPSLPTSRCIPGTPARSDESRLQSLHGLLSIFMQAASLLGKGSLF